MHSEPENMGQRLAEASGPELWRGLEEWAETPEFREQAEREFPEGASEWNDPVTRRHFISMLGASAALAGVVGCSPRPAPKREIYAYATQPEQVTPGLPLYFASSFCLNGVATGVLVRSNEGRPTKIEGNPSHPGSLGSTDVLTQASVLGLYDPDRSSSILAEGGTPRTFEDAIAVIRKSFKEHRGPGLRVLTGTVTSPTLASLLSELPADCWVQYDPVNRDNVREGARKAFGKPFNVIYDFKKADVVVSLDGDFLGCGAGSVRYSRDFASRRRVRTNTDHGHLVANDGVEKKDMSRLYVVESQLSTTGASADHRLPVKPSEVETFARLLAAELKVAGAPSAGQAPTSFKEWAAPLAKDLLSRPKGRTLVVAGESQSASVHALAHAINDALGNLNETVLLTAPLEAKPTNQLDDLKKLVADMNAGTVKMIIVVGGNPIFDAPYDLKFGEAFEKVPLRVHHGLYEDETASLCHWHVPEAHYLESWGDARAYDGTVSLIQPLIAPLYNGRSAIELFAALLEKTEQAGREVVRAYWQTKFEAQKRSGTFDLFWQRSLQAGVMADSAFPPQKLDLQKSWSEGATAPAAGAAPYEVSFKPDPTLFDGRFANNGWLQELPKPITKLTWDNAALMSPKTAEALGISIVPRWTGGERGRMEVTLVKLKAKGEEVLAGAWVVPGHADNTITVYLGHGRTRAGRVGNGTGFNAYKLRSSANLSTASDVDVKKGDDTMYLACTQAIYSMEGRRPIRRATLAEFTKEPDFAKVPPAAAGETDLIYQNVPGDPSEEATKKREEQRRHNHDHKHDDHKHDDHKHHHEHDKRLVPLTLYPQTSKEGRRWGMTIDLSACTGCSACIVACQAENNIPVVGKKEITRGHEMQWLRVDRYFTIAGADEKQKDPGEKFDTVKNSGEISTYFQPVPCMHCEKAPCELVCPVNATVHSADGLNDMVYNRCVGTRYCSNNCPYKVRRFNFYTYADFATESLKLLRNPDVTSRSRGVMEKCTYCVQRIRGAEIEAERNWETREKDADGRPAIMDGEILTACQAACPSQAIVFGDIADVHSHGGKGSLVRRLKQEPTNYGLLAELNTMPRTTYLAALRNTNPDMPKPKGA